MSDYSTYLRKIYKKIVNRIQDTISDKSYERRRGTVQKAVLWVRNNIINDEGIVISSKRRFSYLEVTGYTIPTLYQWGEKELARSFVKWLVSIQNEDGSFSAPDGTPYTFDTGQVIRGFVAALDDMPGIEEPLTKACDWILTQVQSDGRLATPSTKMWGTIADDRIHLYVLPPLIEAGNILNKQEYVDTASKILRYYKQKSNLIEFDTLSHFYAYVIESLCDLGEKDLAETAMRNIAKLQKIDGSVPAYKNVNWVCSTGIAQFAVIWYKLGMKEYADKAINYLNKIQNKTGGFYGSYGHGANYFPDAEISWAVKYFLDAYYWKIKMSFNLDIEIFPETIDENDGRVQAILSYFDVLNGKKVIDIGCGKGRFLRILKNQFPESILYGLDISEKMLAYCPKNVETVCSSVLNVKFPDGYFDGVYSVEAIEHAVLPGNAIKEMIRILKPGGRIIIIDKNVAKLGKLKLEQWEQWFKPDEIIKLMAKYGVEANYKFLSYGKHMQPDGLFVAWEGVKNK